MSYSWVLTSSFSLPETSSRRDEYRPADEAPYPGAPLA